MERLFTLSLAQPYNFSKLGKMLEINGILLAEGTWIDKSGQKVLYPADAISTSIKTFVGVPVVFPHTDEKGDIEKVGGFISETWMEDSAGRFKGFVYEPELIALVEENILPSVSVEADLALAFDSIKQCDVAKRLKGRAVALTNKPACHVCNIHGHREVTDIKMEKGGNLQVSTTGAGAGTTDVPPEPPVSAEALLKEISEKLQQAYPMPKTKAWGDMTESEKMGACVLFMHHKGYKYPGKYPAAKKVKDEMTGEEKWQFEPGFPEDLQKTITDFESAVKSLNDQLQAVKNELLQREVAKVNELTAEIKTIDESFDQKAFLEGVTCPKEQRTMLEKYSARVKALAPKLKIQGVQPPPSEKDRLDKISMEAFGLPLDTILKRIGEK